MEILRIEDMHEDESPKVEIYDASFTDPGTQKQVVAQFHIEEKGNSVAIGQLFGGLVIGKRDSRNG